jgi:hypothetical protein
MFRLRVSAVLLAVAILTSCGGPRLSDSQLKNFTYTAGFRGQQYHLQDGKYQARDDRSNSTTSVELVKDALGDLSGAGDAAVIVASNFGGSGTFYKLIAVLNEKGAPKESGAADLGDRQKINALSIANQRITVDFLTQGPKDPLCCPTQHLVREYQLVNGQLSKVSERVAG